MPMKKLAITAVLLASIGLSGCDRPPLDSTGPSITSPLIVEMNPSGRAPLAGVARFTTNEPVRATIMVFDDDGHRFSASSGEEPATEHAIVLLGFRPNRRHMLALALEGDDGTETPAASLSIVSPELANETPPIEVTVNEPAAVEPGLTLVPIFRWINRQIDQNHSQILIVDADGEIVWQYVAPHGLYEVKRLDNGNLVYLNFGWKMTEIDMLGNVVREWHPAGTQKDASAASIPVDTDTFHHDVVVMPSGNYLSLSTEVREIADWYSDDVETNPDAPRVTRDVIGDVLVEFQPDGTVVNEWKFFDLIDPYRIGYGSLNPAFYEGVYEEPAPDWTHMNGIHYDAATNAALVSTNHLSTVFNLDLDSGELIWMLGDPTGWRRPWRDLLLEPEVDGMIWSYHHHSPKWTPAGTMLLFDNGAVRAVPPNPPQLDPEAAFSRAVEYQIDAETGTVREVWSYGGPGDEQFLSAYISDADWLPATGNILVTKGGRIRDRHGNVLMFPEQGHNWITVTEVTHTTPADKVWELVIDDPRWGVAAFRTERIPGLYR